MDSTQAGSAAHSDANARMQGKRIGFVGGGNMAGALVRGLLHSHTVTADRIRVADVDEDRRRDLSERYGVATSDDRTFVGMSALGTWTLIATPLTSDEGPCLDITRMEIMESGHVTQGL